MLLTCHPFVEDRVMPASMIGIQRRLRLMVWGVMMRKFMPFVFLSFFLPFSLSCFLFNDSFFVLLS